MTNNEIKDLKRQYKTLDSQIQTEVKNLIKLLETMPIEYIDLGNIVNEIETLQIHKNSIKSTLLAKKAF